MSRVMKVKELKEVLAVYDENLPVTFESCDVGGRWPEGRVLMVIGTDHDINHVVPVGQNDQHLRITLHKKG